MAVSVAKSEEVAVYSFPSDPHSAWPPLCQILPALCYSPVCCSVSQGLKRLLANTQSALGTIQIMVGLLNIGLGKIVISNNSWFLRSLRAPYWLGAVFIAVGIVYILAEKFPSLCLVGISASMNLLSAALSITGIVLYADLGPGRMLLGGLDALLIVLAVLQLCVSISSAVLSIKALCKYQQEQNEITEEVKYYKPLLDITSTTSPVV
uniref:membrane-spanning 4-domains subfamily A member 15-like n=1 Tax=Centroberyx gerrardi TaxID=166262 RepID=UPI003AAFCCD3